MSPSSAALGIVSEKSLEEPHVAVEELKARKMRSDARARFRPRAFCHRPAFLIRNCIEATISSLTSRPSLGCGKLDWSLYRRLNNPLWNDGEGIEPKKASRGLRMPDTIEAATVPSFCGSQKCRRPKPYARCRQSPRPATLEPPS